ncbi:MAG: sugar phosphate isomerase/epimerase [Planctomycetes bacterium]|nr:sugar phosphate isomerase/epimerase [Planctomycetota bacterium]
MKLSYLFYDPIVDLSELARRMAVLAELGYQGVELTACHPPPFSAADLLRVSREVQLPVVSFLSGWSYGHEKMCLASAEVSVRQRTVERLTGYVEFAAELGALVVVGLLQGLRTDEPDEAQAVARIADGLGQVARRAEACGGQLVLEPVNHLQVGFHHTAAEAAALVERVGSPALGYMLDTIHVHIEERSMAETIRQHGGRIRHFHLCESNGGPFGSGALDFPLVLKTLHATGYRRYLSVKIYRQLDWETAARTAAAHVLPLLASLGS